MTTKTNTKVRTRLTDMEYDEVSFVGLAANQEADIVLFKSARKKAMECDCAAPTGTERDSNGNKVCETCGGIMKSATPRGDYAKVDPPANDVVAKAQRAITLANAKDAIAKSDFCKCKENAPKKGGGKCAKCGKVISMKVTKSDTISKYNPNHSKTDGKFTSGRSGGMGIRGGDAKVGGGKGRVNTATPGKLLNGDIISRLGSDSGKHLVLGVRQSKTGMMHEIKTDKTGGKFVKISSSENVVLHGNIYPGKRSKTVRRK